MSRRTWVEIDTKCIVDNFNIIKNKVNGAMICPVIKDNAYGHGAVKLAHLYEDLGANYFAVSTLEEAIELREGGINTSILILGYTPLEDTDKLFRYNITQCVYSLPYARSLNEYGLKIKCHLKIDTGMNRIGFKDVDEMKKACLLNNLDFEGVFMHFSDCLDDDFSKIQYDLFIKDIDLLKQEGITFKIRHCANSGTIMKHPFYHLDMVRPGIILYGLGGYEGLKQALTMKSVISHIKEVKKGEPIGYDRRFVADKDIKVATVSVGYGDGFSRLHSGRNTVGINGKEVNILGNICMDQMMVDVSDVACDLYDEVLIYGDLEKMAANIYTISYELICDVNSRVEKIYI